MPLRGKLGTDRLTMRIYGKVVSMHCTALLNM